MERKKEHFFKDGKLSIDDVVTAIENDPSQTRGIMEFIAQEMEKEEEFKEKMHALDDEYKEKKVELHKEYGMDLDY